MSSKISAVDRALVREFIQATAHELVDDLSAWVRIPSISADPAHAADVTASAEWLRDALLRTGFPTAELIETAGAPAVYAEWPAADPDAPVVLVYGHHDVQPVDPLELWDAPPFEPVRDGDVLRGRGACDDKGQLVFHLLGMRAHLQLTGLSAPAVTVKMIIEGEEESGSPHFATLLREHRDRLACDVIVVSDTGFFDRDTPSAVVSMRGLIDCDVQLHGPDLDLHSGGFGGAVPNPLHAMASLLAALHDDRGVIAVPGFYDDVVPVTEQQRSLMSQLPFDEQGWLADVAKSRATYGEEGYSTLERLGARPTAEVNGMWGGYTGPGGKTIVPTDAFAKLSFRLVADQAPARVQECVRAFVQANTPDGIDATVTFHGPGVRPCRSDVDDPAYMALTRAIEGTFDKQMLPLMEGGSGPEADLAEIIDAPMVFLGVGLPEDRMHAPNERVNLPLLLKAAEATAYLWVELATDEPQTSASEEGSR